MNLDKLCNRDLMNLQRTIIDEMNRTGGWDDRTKLDAVTDEIAQRRDSGRML